MIYEFSWYKNGKRQFIKEHDIVKIYNMLENIGQIDTTDESPYFEAVLKKNGKSWDDYPDKETEWEDFYNDYQNKMLYEDLTDEEILGVIKDNFKHDFEIIRYSVGSIAETWNGEEWI